MRKISSFLLLLLITVGSSTFAQVVQAVSMAPKDSSGAFAGGAVQQFVSAGVARKAVIAYLKKTMSPFEDAKKKNLTDEAEAAFSKQDFLTAEQYPNYLALFDKVSKREAETVGKITIDNIAKMEQTSLLYRVNSVSQSANCFTERDNGSFIPQVDFDGANITGFSLESLKSNPRYGLTEAYSQGFSRIKKDMVFGFLNLCGEEVIPAQYDFADRFNDGKALVKKFVWHFVNTNGEESEVLENVIDAKALRYGVSLVKFKNNKFALIDNSFDITKKTISSLYDEIEPFIGNVFKVRSGKAYGLIKIDGTNLTDVNFDRIYLSEADKWIMVEQNKKVGLIDADGNTRIKPTYDYIKGVIIDPSISPNAATVIAKDATGLRLIELNERKLSEVYATIGDFNRFGLAPACKNVGDKGIKCGYLSYEGTEVIPTVYDEVQPFGLYGLAVVSEKSLNCSKPIGNCTYDMVYDRFGRIIIDKVNPTAPEGFRYTVTDTLLASALIVIKTLVPTEKSGTIDGYNLVDRNSFKRFTTQAYQNIKRFDRNHLAILKDDKWGLVDLTGKEVLPASYKEILHSSEGLFGVRHENGKLGFIDKKGAIKITYEYTEINPFKNGMAVVSKGANKYGIINKFGAKIAPCLFKNVKHNEETNIYELTDTSNNIYNLNSAGDCVSSNSAKFYDIIRKANQKD